MRYDRVMLIAAFCVALAAGSSATPIPVFDAKLLVEQSDIIVIGAVQRIAETSRALIDVGAGQMPARAMRGEILVDQFLKGEDERSVVPFEFSIPEYSIGYAGVGSDSYVIMFLRRRNNHYEFVSPYYPTLTAVPVARLESGNVYDKLAAAIAAVLDSPSIADVAKQMATYRLSQIPGAAPRGFLRGALKNSSDSVRLTAAAALLTLNELDVLPIVEEALIGQRGRTHDVSPQVLHNLAAAVALASVDEAAVPSLARILKSPEVQIRRAAAMALRRVDSPLVMPVLAQALDDADSEVQFYAVIGLASIARDKAWRPSPDEFRKYPERYVTYWKNRVKSR